jgi:hypothetical protein
MTRNDVSAEHARLGKGLRSSRLSRSLFSLSHRQTLAASTNSKTSSLGCCIASLPLHLHEKAVQHTPTKRKLAHPVDHRLVALHVVASLPPIGGSDHHSRRGYIHNVISPIHQLGLSTGYRQNRE